MSDCPSNGERDTAVRYLAGRLSEAEAQSFEEHFFSCADCRDDVSRGSELRAALGKPPIVAPPQRRPLVAVWLPLAAAVAIMVIGLGFWQMSRRSEATGISGLRSGQATLAVDVAPEPRGGFRLSWPALPSAQTYEVEIFGADGATLWKGESREPRLSLGPDVVPASGGAPPLVQVEGFDALRQSVGRSEPTPLVAPGGKP